MHHKLPPLRLTGGVCLRDGELQQRSVGIVNGRFQPGPHDEVDLSGYFLLPGIIDLHGDAFERHIAPRPSAPFPIRSGLRGVDRDAAANGVTTAWLAQSWSWEGGMRGADFAEKVMAELHAYRFEALTDLRLQIRYETHDHDTAERLFAAVRRWGVDYVVFNNHLDEALEMATAQPGDLAAWARRSGKTGAELLAVVKAAKARQSEVPGRLARLAEAFDTLRVAYGSHDDPDGETREEFSLIGAHICEFPTRRAPAAVAAAIGNPVLMGAPNVVRGGSQAGNISAVDLIADGLCTALVSDYHYPALAQAALMLAADGVLPLVKAWDLISKAPADIMGLADRGSIAPNMRADLVVMRQDTGVIEATIANGALAYVAGEAAARFMRSALVRRPAMAAE